MARRKSNTSKEEAPKFVKTTWLSLDLRSKEERMSAQEYLDAEKIIIALVNIADEGGSFHVKPQEDGTVKVMCFLPLEGSSNQIGISAFGKTPFEALGALSYKFEVLLPQHYDMLDDDEDDWVMG